MEQKEETIGKDSSEDANAEGMDEGHPMYALLTEGYALETPRRGEIRTGTIARITENDVLVDVGAKSEGVIPGQELERLSEDQRAEIVVGSEVTVYVIRTRTDDGTIILSLARAEEEKEWVQAKELMESQEPYEGTVAGYNKGGLIVKMGSLRGFLPASQVSLSRRRRAQGDTPEKRWGKMVGEPIVSKVVEVDRSRNRLILSERAAAREAREVLKERLIAELEPGEIRTGHVISLADFGAFVDIGGADGLVHNSEISWKRISHPREVLKVGQKVDVKIMSLDPERKRISLSLRELEDDPWESVVDGLEEGHLVEGTITKLTKFGAFACLEDTGEYEIEGLIHISELSDRRIEHPRDVTQEGVKLTLRIISLDRERRRIGLSLKKVDSQEFADLDWKMAMKESAAKEETAAEGEVVETPIEDFDQALEDEQAELPLEELEQSGEPSEEGEQEESSEPDANIEVEVEDQASDSDHDEVEDADEPAAQAQVEVEDQASDSDQDEAEDADEPAAQAQVEVKDQASDSDQDEVEDADEPAAQAQVEVEDQASDSDQDEVEDPDEPAAQAQLEVEDQASGSDQDEVEDPDEPAAQAQLEVEDQASGSDQDEVEDPDEPAAQAQLEVEDQASDSHQDEPEGLALPTDPPPEDEEISSPQEQAEAEDEQPSVDEASEPPDAGGTSSED